jgi:hypothetical protein
VQLIDERKSISYRKRRTNDEGKMTVYQQRSSEISDRLFVIRSELKAANAILIRSEEINLRVKVAIKDNQVKDRPHIRNHNNAYHSRPIR